MSTKFREVSCSECGRDLHDEAYQKCTTCGCVICEHCGSVCKSCGRCICTDDQMGCYHCGERYCEQCMDRLEWTCKQCHKDVTGPEEDSDAE